MAKLHFKKYCTLSFYGVEMLEIKNTRSYNRYIYEVRVLAPSWGRQAK